MKLCFWGNITLQPLHSKMLGLKVVVDMEIWGITLTLPESNIVTFIATSVVGTATATDTSTTTSTATATTGEKILNDFTL